MWTRFFQRWLSRRAPAPAGFGVAADLMARADATAGHDPRGAAELRGAALAYLGVVR